MVTKQEFTMVLNAKLQVAEMNQALKSFQSNLNGLKLPDSLFKSTTKDIEKLQSHLKDFEVLTSKTSFNNSDVNQILSLYGKIGNEVKALGIDLKSLGNIDLQKLMPTDVLQRFQKLGQLLNQIQGQIDFKSSIPDQLKDLGIQADETKSKIKDLENELQQLNNKKNTISSNLASNQTEQRQTQNEINLLEKRQKAFVDNRAKNSETIKKNQLELNKLQAQAEKLQIQIETLKKQIPASRGAIQTAQREGALEKAKIDLKSTEDEIKRIQSEQRSLKAQKEPTSTKEYQDRQKQIENLIQKLNELKQKERELNQGQKTNNKDIDLKTKEYEAQKQALDEINQKIQQLNTSNTDTSKIEEIRKSLADLLGVDISKIPQDLEKLKEITSSLSADQLEQVKTVLKSLGIDISNLGNSYGKLKGDIKGVKEEQEKFNQTNSDISAFKSRIKYLLGLNNAVKLFKRGIRSAFNTVKDLDAAMTETAVVTNMTISDMWKQLPEYTTRANQLGVTTLDAYKAATLYYQQGLNDQQVAELSTETLKMARIAGLEAAEATDRMTNALRGFNMELNAVNAQKIDDVYSQLAAMSASNVDEISTAMTKVASLAHNANMEFETTAALLAQIIETTRESPETAGTALKTVVARFSEVKKMIDENQLKGADEEGQVIDVNKVSQALRIADIDLNKYFVGEVGLDDIFMELASKWDNLTNVQQRYIATQAAGSRQQSRFIAMMQDYARTQELVSAAYNSNGASARQFEKTQDSLQSKLARLKNAWDAFLMGVTNNGIIKTAVDVLTLLLNVLNKIADAFGPAASGAIKFGMALGSLAALRKIFVTGGGLTKLLGGLGNTKVGTWLGFGGNKMGDSAAQAGVGFKAQVASAGQIWQAAVARSAGVQTTTNITNPNQATNTLSLWGRIQQFKANSLDPRQKDMWKLDPAYLQARQAYRMSPTQGNLRNLGQARLNAVNANNRIATPKTLFGALGNKFAGTKIGGGIAKGIGAGLGKLGIGTGAAVGGAAALATTLGVIGAAGLAIYGVVKLIKTLNPTLEEQIKKAEENAKLTSEAATKAKNQKVEMERVQEESSTYDEAVDKSITNEQRTKAIKDRNEYITSLLEQNAAYAKYIHTTFENGEIVLTLDSDALAEAVDKIADTAVRAGAYNAVAQARLSNLRYQYSVKQAYGDDWVGRVLYLYGQSNLKTRGDFETDQEYSQYLRYIENAEKQQQATQTYLQQAAAVFMPENLSDKQAELITDYLSESLKNVNIPLLATEIDPEIARTFVSMVFGWDREKLEQEYYNYYQAEPEKDLTDKQLQQLILDAMTTETVFNVTIEKAEQLLSGENASVYEKLLSASIGSGLENIDLSNINPEDISEVLGIDGDLDNYINELASVTGEEAEVIRRRIVDQIKLAKQIQRETKQRIFTNTFKTGASLTPDQAEWITNLEPEQARQLEAITSKAGNLLNGEQYQELLENLQNKDLDWSKTQELLDSINLDKPIDAFLQLQKVIETNQNQLGELAQGILDTNKIAFSSEALFLDFINSDSYAEITESLDKFIEKNGEISSSNILELAESNEKLNQLLQTGVITSKALAVALTGIEKNGTIAATDLTSSIIAALNAMDDLDGVVKKTIDDLNNFDPGYDENDVTEFIKKVFDFSNEQLEKGAIGNNQMERYMEYIFGPIDFSKYPGMSYEDAYSSWLQENLSWLEANQDNMKSAWKDLLINSPEEVLALSSEKIGGDAVRIWEEDGEILIDTAGHTTEELVQILSEGSDLTEQQIRMMITDYKNYSGDFKHILEEADTERAVLEWYENLGEAINGEKLVIDKDLETLAKLLGVKTEEIEDILKKHGKRFNTYNWDNNLSNAENVQSILQENTQPTDLFSQHYKKVGEEGVFYGNWDVIDYDKLKNNLENLGLSQYFDETLNEMAKDYDKFIATINGEPVEIDIKTGETAVAAYQRTVEELNRQDLADRIGEKLKDLNIQFTIDGKVYGQLDELQTTLKDIERTYELVFDGTIDPQLKTLLTLLGNLSPSIFISGGPDKNVGATPVSQISASGGIVGSYANGVSSNKLKPGMALTGEEAPEIVWNKEKGYAYITGARGPQFQNLKPGDQVFNGQETKKILNNSGQRENLFGSYAKTRNRRDDLDKVLEEAREGTNNSIAHGYGNGNKSGSGSGNNNNKSSKDWKNELDWLYDLMEDIAEEEHKQTLIQSEYELAEKDLAKTGRDLYNLTKAELDTLQAQLSAQQFAFEKRLQQMNELQQKVVAEGFEEYLRWNPEDNSLEIDWDKINEITDKDTYDKLSDLVSDMEKVQDQMDEAQEATLDIKKQIQELQTRYLQAYLDFQNRVMEAVVAQYQQTIDSLSELNDTINEANESILDSIQKEIDLQRQIRDNTDTEKEIASMEARLAMLQRDTTGANQQEILELQKQLDEARENYSDTLIDQAIDRLSQNNDDAQEQREKQIELLEAQLEYWQETGALWEEVAKLIADGFTSQGSIIQGSELWEFLKDADSWNGLSQAQKENWANELILESAQVGAYLTQLNDGVDVSTDRIIDSIIGEHGLAGEITTETRIVRAQLNELIATLGGTPIDSIPGEGGYASGGLATKTGLAMLHGTANEPEYVLNARQTGAFLRLADVLPSIFGSGTGTTNNYGTNVYVELNMSVGEIGSDYDVDRLVARVKDDIYDASSYRNVNTVSFLR